MPFRYIAVTSDMDEKTGKSVRVHHHVIVNAEAAEIARKKWKGGEVHEERLFDEVTGQGWRGICSTRCAACRTRRNTYQAGT